MKTSEDKLNEALRAALKRKFDNFEAVPGPSSLDKIRAQLKPAPNWKYLIFTVVFLGIFVAGIKLDQSMLRKKNARSVQSAQKVLRLNVGEKRLNTLPAAATHEIKSVIVGKQGHGVTLGAVYRPKSPRKNAGSVTKNSELLVSAGKNPVRVSDDMPARESKATEPVAALEPEKLAGQPAIFSSFNPGLPQVEFTGDVERYKLLNIKPRRMSFLLNATALQGYQILTVPSSAGQNFQNFAFPSALSRQSLGYKFSAGVDKNGFQFVLHYSGFKQSYTYEIAGSDYIVEPVDKDNYNVIRPGERISETRKYRLLGIGVNKEVRWGHSPFSRYFARAGSEYAQSLNSRQRIAWVNIGAGKQFAIGNQMLLYLGPYAEFSPGRISSDKSPFFYQPYRIGISLGLKLVRP